MRPLGDAAALATAMIWAYASLAYKPFIARLGALRTNVMRMLYASLATLPFALALMTFKEGEAFAVLSGVLSLSVGDTMYLASIGSAGLSVAAPLSYTYVILAEVISTVLLGERLTPGLAAAGALIVAGVALISVGPGGRASPRGVAMALGASGAWALGQVMIGLADAGGVPPVVIAFLRVAASGALLAAGLKLAARLRGGDAGLMSALRRTARSSLPLVAALDLGLGVTLFALSVRASGFDQAVVIVSSLPLFAQLMAWLSGAERPRPTEVAGAAAVVVAVAVAFMA
ncbi:hypothetical protein ASAC_0715 [Acidilobus saccharovorans 345-15]|uniref:EamA domain-containing protein n=1 Tax=Acidilobus saccharovorans (strain DSM 16705 / JCM 18335 / VKM B-2471 / 345-15) TaxID=666510 RepID=D9Q1D3_ACIS3|nr:DMT family transporter [Acidilobus saccharovorans]ADL19121.1 hypothetical protein ASAC_0715 [Acidilobus saccharovorans 345-15]